MTWALAEDVSTYLTLDPVTLVSGHCSSGEDSVPVRYCPQQMTAKPLAKLHRPFLTVAGAETSFSGRGREDSFRAVHLATNVGKTLVKVAARYVPEAPSRAIAVRVPVTASAGGPPGGRCVYHQAG